jgi:hypothetical protein
MTLDVQIPRVDYTGDGFQTVFPFTFRLLNNSDLRVFVDDVQQVENTDYTILDLTEEGGDVSFFVAPADTLPIIIKRVTSRSQQVDYEPFDAFPAETHETALDKLTMIAQELQSSVNTGDDLNDHIGDFDNPHHTNWGNIEGDPSNTLDPFYLRRDGTTQLTANWDAGPFNINIAADQTYNIDGEPHSHSDLLGEAWPSGLYDGGEINIAPTAADVEVIAGAGVIVDSYTDPLAIPVQTRLSWPTINEVITAAPAVAGSIVRILIADGAVPGPIPDTNLGVLVQQGFPATPSQLRDQLFLGVLIHNGTAWKDVSSPVVVNNGVVSFNEFTRQVNGPAYVEGGGQVHEAAGFTLDRDAGAVWEMNRNWHVNKKDPNREAFPEQLNFQWSYTNRDFTDVSAPTGVADPTMYDNAGTVELVPGGLNQCTIQRVYVDIGDNYWVLWGQNVYDNYVEAAASLGADTAATEIPHLLASGSILLGYIIAEKGKTDWDTDEARFVSTVVAVGGGATLPVQAFLDLNDTPSDYIGDARKSAVVSDDELLIEFDTRVRWRNVWIDGTYYNGDMVLDAPYTMIANKTTTDRAAPQNLGAPAYTLPETPAWGSFQQTARIGSGHTYTFNEAVYVRSVRVWVPTVGGDTGYILTAVTPSGVAQIPLFDLTANQWNTIGVDERLFTTGDQATVYLESENSGSSTQVTGGWRRGPNDNNAEPANQEWNVSNNGDTLRIDFTDLDSLDRQAELEGIIVGSTIQFAETASPSTFITYRVTSAPVTGITSVIYGVVIEDQGLTVPAVGVVTTMTAEIPIAAPTDYVGIVGNWSGNQPVWGTIESFLEFDGVDQGANPDNAYSVDILVQRLSVSPDWDLVAKSG